MGQQQFDRSRDAADTVSSETSQKTGAKFTPGQVVYWYPSRAVARVPEGVPAVPVRKRVAVRLQDPHPPYHVRIAFVNVHGNLVSRWALPAELEAA